MVNFPIKFGFFELKLFIPFSYAIVGIVHGFYVKDVLERTPHLIVTEISASLGHISIIFLSKVKCLPFDNKKFSQAYQKNKRFMLHYFFFIGTFIVHIVLLSLCSQLRPNSERKSNILYLASEVRGLYSINGLDIVFTFIVSMLLNRTHYYSHHYFSIIFFIGTCFIIDYFLGNYIYQFNSDFLYYILVCVIQIIFNAISYCYQKVMYVKYKYSPFHTCFCFGVTFMLYHIITIISMLIKGEKDDLAEYFIENETHMIIIRFITNWIMVFLEYLFISLTNYFYSPVHIVYNLSIGNMIHCLLDSKSDLKYYAIIFFVFQICLLLVYQEILEINCCDLNHYTYKNLCLPRDKNEKLSINNTNLVLYNTDSDNTFSNDTQIN
jgi:hypothetical protein